MNNAYRAAGRLRRWAGIAVHGSRCAWALRASRRADRRAGQRPRQPRAVRQRQAGASAPRGGSRWPSPTAQEQVATVEKLKGEAFDAARSGHFDRTTQLLDEAAAMSKDPSLARMVALDEPVREAAPGVRHRAAQAVREGSRQRQAAAGQPQGRLRHRRRRQRLRPGRRQEGVPRREVGRRPDHQDRQPRPSSTTRPSSGSARCGFIPTWRRSSRPTRCGRSGSRPRPAASGCWRSTRPSRSRRLQEADSKDRDEAKALLEKADKDKKDGDKPADAKKEDEEAATRRSTTTASASTGARRSAASAWTCSGTRWSTPRKTTSARPATRSSASAASKASVPC